MFHSKRWEFEGFRQRVFTREEREANLKECAIGGGRRVSRPEFRTEQKREKDAIDRGDVGRAEFHLRPMTAMLGATLREIQQRNCGGSGTPAEARPGKTR